MIAAAKLAVAAAYTLASFGCPPQKPVETVELAFTSRPPVITNDQPSSALGAYQISTTFARSRNEIFSVGGLHITEFAPRYLISFAVGDAGGGKVCMAPAGVRIEVDYAPRILIAREAAPGTCNYKTILDHEMRHVGTDVVTFNEFLPRIKAAMQEAVRKIPQIGPMPPESMEKAKNIIVDAVRAELEKQVDELELVRLNRQQLIDTRQEYLRLGKACQK